MIEKIKEFLIGIPNFLKANIFVLITGFIVVAKLYFFNENFYLLNEKLVMLVVSTVIVFCFLAPIVFFPDKRVKYSSIWNGIFTFFILSDTIYIRYFDSLPSFQSIFYADSVFGVMGSVKGLMHIQDILLIIDIPILIYIFKKFRKSGITDFNKKTSNVYNFLFVGSCLFCLCFITFYDFKNVKLLTSKGYDNRVTAERYGVTGYHILDIYRFAQSRFNRLSEADKQKTLEEAKKYINHESSNDLTGSAKGKSVIVLQFESLQGFVVGKKVDGQELTPNINKFLNKNDYFNNHYFEIGFGGTADTDFVANSSLYPLQNASTFVQYGKNDYTGVADYLAKAGYSTTAYHGFTRSFWNRNIALKSLGYEKFYGSESYKEYPKLLMGTNDRDFLKKTAKMIKEAKSPSLSYTITLTSHFPFDLPADKKTLNFYNSYPKEIAEYYQSIHYADEAFGEFIETLKEEGLYDDNLIIVYGDHNAIRADINNPDIYRSLGYEKPLTTQESIEFKKVPLIIHKPGQVKGSIRSEVTSHLDIMPTILNLVNIKPTKPYFGQDLYGKSSPFYSAMLYFGSGFIENKDHVFLDGPLSGLENGTCYLVGDGQWRITKNQECAQMVNKRETEQGLSEKLIKYNLLKDLN